jgi:hypothetical protein
MPNGLESPLDQKCSSETARIRFPTPWRSDTPPQMKQDPKYGHLYEFEGLYSKIHGNLTTAFCSMT